MACQRLLFPVLARESSNSPFLPGSAKMPLEFRSLGSLYSKQYRDHCQKISRCRRFGWSARTSWCVLVLQFTNAFKHKTDECICDHFQLVLLCLSVNSLQHWMATVFSVCGLRVCWQPGSCWLLGLISCVNSRVILSLGGGHFRVWSSGFFHGNNVGSGLFSSLIPPTKCSLHTRVLGVTTKVRSRQIFICHMRRTIKSAGNL